MFVSPTSSATATPASATTAVTSAVASDYQTFLNMMTVQLQNQDPTNPMDANDFAMQLATFSGVEQQVLTNDLLSEMAMTLGAQGMASMAGWVGQEARVEAPLAFQGAPVTLSPNPALNATRAVLVVSDAAGQVVDRREMPLSSANYTWDGTTSTGATLPHGVYTLTMESYEGDTLLGTTGVEHYAPILEIRSSPSGVTLLLPGAVEVNAALVTGLRPPPTASAAPLSAIVPVPDPDLDPQAATGPEGPAPAS